MNTTTIGRKHRGLSVLATCTALLVCFVFAQQGAHAKALGQATVTELNNDVRYKAVQAGERRAKVQDVVRGADVLRTGMKSQAELQFEDRTITRLGSNSIFSFDPEKRKFELKSGVLLFDMPKGQGGGRIITPAGTAAIEGTAGIVSNHAKLKVLCLAGVIRVLNAQGKTMAVLQAGQMFVQGVTKTAVEVNLSKLGNGKLLRRGLPNNQGEHDAAKKKQLALLLAGKLQETPFLMIGESPDLFLMQSQFAAATKAAVEVYQKELQQEVDAIYENINGPPVTAGTGDIVDSSQAKILGANGTAKSTGFIGGATGAAEFSAGSWTFTGNPTFSGGEGQFAAVFSTLGNITFDNFQANDYALQNGYKMAFFAGSGNSLISANTSLIGRQTYSVGGSLLMRSLGDIVIAGSTLEASGSSQRGLISLDANGSIIFGSSDPLRTSVADAVGLEGVTSGLSTLGIEMISRGTGDKMGLLLQNASINANSTSAYEIGTGGEIRLQAARQVTLLDTTDIQANGATSGSITVAATGSSTVVGQVAMQTGTSEGGYIRLSAQDSVTVLEAIAQPGSIEIIGTPKGSGKSINIVARGRTAANGDYAGGNIIIGNLSGAGTDNISLTHVQMIAAGRNMLGGHVQITANNNISLIGDVIDAGLITILSRGTSGTIYIRDCTFSTATGSGTGTDAITIRGHNVVFAGNNVFDPGTGRYVNINRSTGSGLPTLTSGSLRGTY